MTIQRLPLKDRLDRLSKNDVAHPEYYGAVILNMACMPLAQYLCFNVTLRGFLKLLKLPATACLTYQAMARHFHAAAQSGALAWDDLTDLLESLADPVLRLEKALRNNDLHLLPTYTPEQPQDSRCIPLEQRLRSGEVLGGLPLDCAQMPVESFYRAVAELTGDPTPRQVYERDIAPLMEGGESYVEAIRTLDTLSDGPGERNPVMLRALIYPFAVLPTLEPERRPL